MDRNCDSSSLNPIWTNKATLKYDWTFHQIAPYIGRMKTSIASSLIKKYTKIGDLIIDPFCGSGVVALEAVAAGRPVIAADWNPYAALLTRAKLFPPENLLDAESRLKIAWELSRNRHAKQDLRSVPKWVRNFFHPTTLKHALAFRDACVDIGDDFLLACLLGILHHQRPGFLSYPASHLVPYLRDKKFPRQSYPEMYEPRDVLIRLQAKIKRTFRRTPKNYNLLKKVIEIDARKFPHTNNINAVITSPPYMNELDYVRDNRLRIWFIRRNIPNGVEDIRREKVQAFRDLIKSVCIRLAPGILEGGYMILVVGDAQKGNFRNGKTTKITKELFKTENILGSFQLISTYEDTIPDIRRSRRECRGTKKESALVFQKT